MGSAVIHYFKFLLVKLRTIQSPTSAFNHLHWGCFIHCVDQYLADTMGYLLGCLKKEKERTAAFQALGLLVVAVRAEIQPYLSKVLEIIKAALPPKDFAHKSVFIL